MRSGDGGEMCIRDRDFHGIEEKILILNLMYNFIGSRDLFVSKNF